jgi:phosphoribosylformylglycinamidine synthase
MSKQVRVLVTRTAGTNCNVETTFAFEQCGAVAHEVHLERLFSGKVKLSDYHILALPGGFSYGDDIASGRIFANELRLKLGEDIARFIKGGKLMIGICNGFQILVKAGILPGPFVLSKTLNQTATLFHNDSGKFEDRWAYLKPSGKCVWTRDMDRVVYFPVAHGEGKFIPASPKVLKDLQENGQVVFRYCQADGSKGGYPENPNGSTDDIAGITDETGRILGLMPHPERHFLRNQHPFWTRLEKNGKFGDGAQVFQNGVDYVRKNLI